MTDIDRESEFDTTYDVAEEEAPNDGDLLLFDSEYGLQLSELDIDADEANAFDIDVRASDSTNPRTKRTYRGTSVEKGSFTSPVVEAGADEEVAIRNRTSASSGQVYTVNVRVDKRSP